MNSTELLTEINFILDMCKHDVDRANIETISLELDNLTQWLARSVEIVADANYIYDGAFADASEIESLIHEKELGAACLNAKIKGACREQKRIVNLADRLNATLVHRIDAVRSMLSARKSEQKQFPQMNQ